MEYTFAMIKPDAVQAKNAGKIIDFIEKNGFDIMRMHKVQLTDEAAQAFYEIHQDKPFFKELVTFIVSGPVIIMALAKDNAVKEWRNLMGATDPKKSDEGTVRNMFGTDISHNAVHGSDSVENAQNELSLFFIDEMDEESMEEDEDEHDYEDDQEEDVD